MKFKQKIKNKINAFKANTCRFKVLSLDEWLNTQGLVENSENRALYAQYRLDIDEKNKKQDKNLSRFIGSALFLAVFVVIFCIMCANSISATDIGTTIFYRADTDEILTSSEWNVANNGNAPLIDVTVTTIPYAISSDIDFSITWGYGNRSYTNSKGVISQYEIYIYTISNADDYYSWVKNAVNMTGASNNIARNYRIYNKLNAIKPLSGPMQEPFPILFDLYYDYWSIYDSGSTDGFNTGYQIGSEEGYDNGFSEGETVGYSNGYNVGYIDGEGVGYFNGSEEGYNNGYNAGYSKGESEGLNTGETLKKGILAIFDAPVQMLQQVFNFEFMGINLYSIFTFILTLGLLAILTKTILGLFK